jgi:hypothetical protein
MNLTEKQQHVLLHTLGYKVCTIGGMFEWKKYDRNHSFDGNGFLQESPVKQEAD